MSKVFSLITSLLRAGRKTFCLHAGVVCLFVVLCCCSSSLQARSYRNSFSDSYFGIGMRAGLGALQPLGIDNFDVTPGFSYGFDICYQGGFGRKFGFLIGVGFTTTSSGVSADSLFSEYNLPENLKQYGMDIVSLAHCVGNTVSIEESYTTTMLEIPVLFTYSMESVFLNLGLKFAIPLQVKSNYRCNETDVYIIGFDEIGQQFADDPKYKETIEPFDGEYSIFGKDGESKAVTVMANAELGYRLHFASNSSLQFSLFVDYSLGSIHVNNPQSDMLLNLTPGNLEYRGITKDGRVTGLSFYKFGLRAQYNIGFGSAPKAGKAIRIL